MKLLDKILFGVLVSAFVGVTGAQLIELNSSTRGQRLLISDIIIPNNKRVTSFTSNIEFVSGVAKANGNWSNHLDITQLQSDSNDIAMEEYAISNGDTLAFSQAARRRAHRNVNSSLETYTVGVSGANGGRWKELVTKARSLQHNSKYVDGWCDAAETINYGETNKVKKGVIIFSDAVVPDVTNKSDVIYNCSRR